MKLSLRGFVEADLFVEARQTRRLFMLNRGELFPRFRDTSCRRGLLRRGRPRVGGGHGACSAGDGRAGGVASADAPLVVLLAFCGGARNLLEFSTRGAALLLQVFELFAQGSAALSFYRMGGAGDLRV